MWSVVMSLTDLVPGEVPVEEGALYGRCSGQRSNDTG